MSDDWLSVQSRPKPDEPISYENWQAREKRHAIVAARLALFARGVTPGPDPVLQLAELEVIDIVTGRDGASRRTSDAGKPEE